VASRRGNEIQKRRRVERERERGEIMVIYGPTEHMPRPTSGARRKLSSLLLLADLLLNSKH